MKRCKKIENAAREEKHELEKAAQHEREDALRAAHELEAAQQHERADAKKAAQQKREDDLEARVRVLQQLVEEREQVRDFMAHETVERAGCIVQLEQRLTEANLCCEKKSTQLEEVKHAASQELMRLLRLLSEMHKQHKEMAGTPHPCGIGLVLEPCRDLSSSASSLHSNPLSSGPLSLARTHDASFGASSSSFTAASFDRSMSRTPQIAHSPSKSTGGHDASLRDAPCAEFVVRDLIEGFSAAMSCALQKGDRVLSIDGLDTYGKTQSAVAALLHGPRGSYLRLVCARSDGIARKAFGVRLRRGKWGVEHALLTEEEADLHAWSRQAEIASSPPFARVLGSRLGAGAAV